jgi:hypothetical protein
VPIRAIAADEFGGHCKNVLGFDAVQQINKEMASNFFE